LRVIQYPADKSLYLFENLISKQGSHAKFIFIDASDALSNAKLFSIILFVSSLIIFTSDSEINDNSIKAFSNVLELPSTITTNVTNVNISLRLIKMPC
jgi:hypothetical protein